MSSAEAQLGDMVKCSDELMGVRSLMLDWGVDSSGVIHADSSAALAIPKRNSACNLRDINESSLWIQERQDRKELECGNVLGTENPTYMNTTYISAHPRGQVHEALEAAACWWPRPVRFRDPT